jgi:hypothetical protein
VIYRITKGQNRVNGGEIYRIYRVEGETAIYLDGTSSLEHAREIVQRLANPVPELTVEEHQA